MTFSERGTAMRIMFVCTGNSCRSPMADLYFNDLCRRANRPDIDACSAGICAWDGDPISRQAAAVMSACGIDSAGFRSSLSSPPGSPRLSLRPKSRAEFFQKVVDKSFYIQYTM